MEQLTFSQVKKGNLTFKSIGTPTGVQGQTPIFSLTKDGETVKYSTDGVNYEILGGGGALIFNNVAVAVADFVTDTTYADYPYRAAIALTGVALTMIANVVFDVTDATSGNFAPLSDTYAGGTYIYAKEVPAAAITIPTIYVLSEAASGGGSGNAWNNRGIWVANVQYNSYDIVYDNAGCFLCVADIASATAPENDTTNWSAVYRTVTPSNTLPVGGVPNAALLKNSVNNYDAKWGLVPLLVTNTEMLNALTDGGFADLQVVTPEDDSGYAIGHLYQFHITNDVYSWTDITPENEKTILFSNSVGIQPSFSAPISLMPSADLTRPLYVIAGGAQNITDPWLKYLETMTYSIHYATPVFMGIPSISTNDTSVFSSQVFLTSNDGFSTIHNYEYHKINITTVTDTNSTAFYIYEIYQLK